jgi:hypothetical protein
MSKRKSRKGKKAQDLSLGAPTPEPRAKAIDRSEDGRRLHEHHRRDALGHYHFDDAPLDRLAARGDLAKTENGKIDRHMNRILLEAGRRYFEHAYLSGMISALKAIDLAGVGGGGDPACGMPANEAQAHHRRQYRDAEQALGQYFSSVVDAIVLREQSLQAVGLRITPYRKAETAAAIALDRLKEGLLRLAQHFRMGGLDKGRPNVAVSGHSPNQRPDRTQPPGVSRSRAPRADNSTPRALRGLSQLRGDVMSKPSVLRRRPFLVRLRRHCDPAGR